MKKLLLLIALITATATVTAYAADDDISVTLNGEAIVLRQSPVIENGRTLVPVREVCEAMNLNVAWNPDIQEIVVSNGEKYVRLEIDYHTIDINGNLQYLEAAPALINDITCMPIRAVIEPFGAMVDWDAKAREIIVKVDKKNSSQSNSNTSTDNANNSADSNPSQNVPSINGNTSGNSSDITDAPADNSEKTGKFTYYAQQGEEWAFESNGRGYCWVCSYAMLISDLTAVRVTPVDIASYNIEMGSSNGNYMANHLVLASRFNLEFVPAISESSQYFERFETSHRGATYFKAETDEDVKNALIEALERNPSGIMVRFEGYPHTLIATEYKNGEIYFNDPGSPTMEDVTFENTCLGRRFTLSDLTFVQALAVK